MNWNLPIAQLLWCGVCVFLPSCFFVHALTRCSVALWSFHFVVLVVFAVDRLGTYALSRHLKAISMVLNFEFPIMLIATPKKDKPLKNQ